jgi:hypothetical protein
LNWGTPRGTAATGISNGSEEMIMTLHDLNGAIENIKNIDDIYEPLGMLVREIERIIGSERVALGQVQEMAGYLTQIRNLVSETVKAECRPDLGGNLLAAYLELEGRVKELRNDLSVISNVSEETF